MKFEHYKRFEHCSGVSNNGIWPKLNDPERCHIPTLHLITFSVLRFQLNILYAV